MDRIRKAELFEEVRRGYEEGETILALAEQCQIYRRMVRQAPANAVPPGRKEQERTLPKLGLLKEFIGEVLEKDRQAPRNQQHTARRIWRRLAAEFGGERCSRRAAYLSDARRQ